MIKEETGKLPEEGLQDSGSYYIYVDFLPSF